MTTHGVQFSDEKLVVVRVYVRWDLRDDGIVRPKYPVDKYVPQELAFDLVRRGLLKQGFVRDVYEPCEGQNEYVALLLGVQL